MPRRRLFSLKAWKTRLVFWSGAVAVGLAASSLAMGSDTALRGFWAIVGHHPLWPFLLTNYAA
ncbi:MAG: hypothetical protein D6819_04050 [Gammaproteobacteria bacterium]|nr:MAG: hypothetical protein D6819_04050 [Gammaproteobacteria bacterium]